MDTGIVNQMVENSGVQSYEKVKSTGKANERTIGSPKLSEKAQKYYEELQKKFSSMDFVLVDNDEREGAETKAAKYARAGRTQVLIDEERLERMAEDAEYRKKYEGIITNAQTQLAQMQNDFGKNASGVKTYGIRIDDNGNASFFAVVDKSLAAQKERIEKKAEQKAEDKKKAAKEEQKEKYEKRFSEKGKDTELVTVTSDSIEGLMKKIQDVMMEIRSDHVQTDSERMIGQHIDYRQ